MVGWCSMGTFNDPWWCQVDPSIHFFFSSSRKLCGTWQVGIFCDFGFLHQAKCACFASSKHQDLWDGPEIWSIPTWVAPNWLNQFPSFFSPDIYISYIKIHFNPMTFVGVITSPHPHVLQLDPRKSLRNHEKSSIFWGSWRGEDPTGGKRYGHTGVAYGNWLDVLETLGQSKMAGKSSIDMAFFWVNFSQL